MTTSTARTLDVEALRTASDSHAELAAAIADDIEWTDISPTRSRTRYSGRAEVLAMLDGLDERGIVTAVLEGFAAGDCAALTVTCTMAEGVLFTNALLHVRDGKITRWFGVEAWDA
jgi:ketosteroid isomerase-like protein